MLGWQAAGSAPLVHGEPVAHPETIATASAVPPAEMKGSGMPVNGIARVTPPMLKAAWKMTQVVMPTAISVPSVSGARRAIW